MHDGHDFEGSFSISVTISLYVDSTTSIASAIPDFFFCSMATDLVRLCGRDMDEVFVIDFVVNDCFLQRKNWIEGLSVLGYFRGCVSHGTTISFFLPFFVLSDKKCQLWYEDRLSCVSRLACSAYLRAVRPRVVCPRVVRPCCGCIILPRTCSGLIPSTCWWGTEVF